MTDLPRRFLMLVTGSAAVSRVLGLNRLDTTTLRLFRMS